MGASCSGSTVCGSQSTKVPVDEITSHKLEEAKQQTPVPDAPPPIVRKDSSVSNKQAKCEPKRPSMKNLVSKQDPVPPTITTCQEHKTKDNKDANSFCEQQIVCEQPVPTIQLPQQPEEHEEPVEGAAQLLYSDLSKTLRQKIDVNWGSFIKLKTKNFEEDYCVVQELGRGAFGTVSKVMLRSTKLMRAMKSIKKSSLIKQDEQKIFAQMCILKQLDHPNILKLYEIYDWKNYFYLITELCEGGELFDKIRKLKHFTQKDAAQVMKSILGAVVYLHKMGIVHRDLKPENMLYTNNQPDSNLKIIDFGTSKKIVPGKKLTKQIGTAYYIAPEVLSKSYDQKCDVWSCGIILYILLSGYPPFRGGNEKEILNKIKSGHLRFENYAWKNVSKEAVNLIKSMLERDPSVRISAYEALNSKWINTPDVQPLAITTLENLRNFHFQNRLKAVVMTYVASQLYSNQDKAELEKVFRSLDNDGDGVIEKNELIQAFNTHYRDHHSLDINGILKLIDTNNSGKIDFTEFLVAASSEQKLLNMNRLESAFNYFDIDRSGFITIEQIKQFLNDSEDTTESIKQLFNQVDVNGDGNITKDEFIELLLKHH